MKAILALFAVAAMAAPTLAQQIGGAVIVMRYKAPDGTEKTLPMAQPGQSLTMGQCRELSPQMVPVFKRQLANAQNFPEFAGWQFVSGRCEMYSSDLVTTVK